jgi:hypothetical protein
MYLKLIIMKMRKKLHFAKSKYNISINYYFLKLKNKLKTWGVFITKTRQMKKEKFCGMRFYTLLD